MGSPLIPDVHHGIPDLHLVQGRIDPKIYDYFFKECIAGYRGARQAFITYFFQQFYEACQAANIHGPWEPEVEIEIRTVLHRINFKPQYDATSCLNPTSPPTT